MLGTTAFSHELSSLFCFSFSLLALSLSLSRRRVIHRSPPLPPWEPSIHPSCKHMLPLIRGWRVQLQYFSTQLEDNSEHETRRKVRKDAGSIGIDMRHGRRTGWASPLASHSPPPSVTGGWQVGAGYTGHDRASTGGRKAWAMETSVFANRLAALPPSCPALVSTALSWGEKVAALEPPKAAPRPPGGLGGCRWPGRAMLLLRRPRSSLSERGIPRPGQGVKAVWCAAGHPLGGGSAASGRPSGQPLGAVSPARKTGMPMQRVPLFISPFRPVSPSSPLRVLRPTPSYCTARLQSARSRMLGT